MKLIEYLNLFKNGCDVDTTDTEIDEVVTICYDKNDKPDEDFPFLFKFTNKLLSKVDIAYLNNGGMCPVVADYSKLILNNIDLFKDFVKKNWIEEKQYVLDDIVELQYEFIKDFHLILAGYGTETDNRNYYNLLANCKA